MRFRGAVEIDLKVNAETSKIVLNTVDLQLYDVSVTIPGGEEVFVPVSQSRDSTNQRATFAFPNTFAVGVSLKLFIVFEGQLSGNLIGYYEGTWEHGSEKKIYTVTQFAATAARRAFPCWDEPALKATFVMSMISDSNSVNIFNTLAVSEEPYAEADDVYGLLKGASRHEWKITRFEASPLMSTYLVAYANGQFEYIESSFTSPISGKTRPIRVYAAPSSIHQAKYCLEVTAKVLPVYEEVFDIEYPLSKLDTLVIQDLDVAAMENWGLITGRGSRYLLDPDASDLQQKQAIVSTVFHEVAHMWVFPEWKLDSAFIATHVGRAMRIDDRLSSHPVEVDCPDANKINQAS
ncbi:peptidase M1, membrane alanine aminopeptidase [Rhodocollybia butyracea]|uniref:Peptidase M1, membrane alanine aminopeptidase n=1 Tax=Rhodocollybia butyracea TaxID=206335 RepID=A0A9P5UGD2_9AGAR|nr:peptidase M1, membrane alanine aminopeptidase [Rhodocollybia butyracea]